jgi:ankyrin repeat protein
MSDSTTAKQLPEKPSLDQLRKQAKELRSSGDYPTLAAAQFALAKGYGFPSWTKMAFAIQQKALRLAIHEGDNEALGKLLAANSRLAKAQFAEGDWPLHLAAENNDPAMIEALVAAGAQLNPKYGNSSHTALSWAVTCWSYHAAIKLIQLGDKPDLFCAAGIGVLEWVKQFWPNETLVANPSRTGSSRYSESGEALPRPPKDPIDQVSDALYIACRNGRLDVARWLLDHGADPNWRAYVGATPLAWAEFSDNRELCDLVRGRGGSDEFKDFEFGADPRVFGVMVLAGWGFAPQLEARLAADPSLIDVRADCGTLLHAAARSGQLRCTEILLAHGADRLAPDAEGRTPGVLAAEKRHEELAKLLS